MAIPTRDELNDMASRAQAGDREAADGVARGVWYFVRQRAGRVASRTGVEMDELFGEGMAAVPRALRSWNPERGAFFTYFATACCRAMATAAKEMCEESRRFPAVDSCAEIPHTTDRADMPHNTADLRAVMAEMPEQMRTAVTLRHGLGGEKRLSNDRAAERMGVSRSVCQWMYQVAMEHLRERFGVDWL